MALFWKNLALLCGGSALCTWRRRIKISGDIERGVKFNYCGSFWKDLAPALEEEKSIYVSGEIERGVIQLLRLFLKGFGSIVWW